MPIVPPGASDGGGHQRRSGRSTTASVCRCRQASRAWAARRIGKAEDRGGKKRGIDRARLADREGGDRYPGRHLDDRQQAVDALQHAAFDRHAQHRQRRQRRRHARQVGGPAGAGNDHPQAALARTFRVTVEPVGRAMGGNDPRLAADAEPIERAGGVLHRFPIGLAAHDDAYRRSGFAHGAPFRLRRAAPHYRGPHPAHKRRAMICGAGAIPSVPCPRMTGTGRDKHRRSCAWRSAGRPPSGRGNRRPART